MLRLLSLILRNVLRNRRRTLLTLASTAISLALLALLLAMYQGFFHGEDTSPEEARRLICRHRVSLTQVLPASHMAKIKAVPGVQHISAWTWFQGKWGEPKDFFARFAVDADVIFDLRTDWKLPAEQVTEFKSNRVACAVGKAIADKYKLKLGQQIIIEGDIYPVKLELTLVGIFDHPKYTECLIFHREYLTELLPKTNNQRNSVGTYALLAERPEDVPRIAKAVDAMFENSPYPTRTESEKEFGRSFLAFLGNIKLFLAAICGAVTFTILLVSANTIAMSVRERTREMAILRTLGYAPSEILQMILGESLIISFFGGLIGIVLGAGLAKLMSEAGGGFPMPGVKWQSASVVIAIALIVGFLAALVPAIIASKKNVVESLRFTG